MLGPAWTEARCEPRAAGLRAGALARVEPFDPARPVVLPPDVLAADVLAAGVLAAGVLAAGGAPEAAFRLPVPPDREPEEPPPDRGRVAVDVRLAMARRYRSCTRSPSSHIGRRGEDPPDGGPRAGQTSTTTGMIIGRRR